MTVVICYYCRHAEFISVSDLCNSVVRDPDLRQDDSSRSRMQVVICYYCRHAEFAYMDEGT